MVRRSTVDRSPQSVVHSADYDAGTGNLPTAGGRARQRTPGWGGAGGRWLVWVFRVVVWVVLLLIGYRGITAIVFNETPNGSSQAPAATKGATFPAELAGAFAMQFGQVYLNADPASESERATELAQFLPPGTDPELGYNGAGSLQLQSEEIAGIRARDPHHGVVMLLVRVNGRLMELGVPIYAAAGQQMVISGEPAFLPPPARAALPSTSPVISDPTAQSALTAQLGDFFRAYASGNADTLARFVVPGAEVTGLGGDVTFGELNGVSVPQGGTTRHIIATVVWHIPGSAAGGSKAAATSSAAGFEMSYALTVTKRDGTWYVKSIGPASHAAGSP
jgi:hypothetical protein